MGRIAVAMGTPLMPWQAYVADVAGEIDPATGRMAYDIVVVTVPRQSGKTTLVRAVAMQRLMTPGGRVWYTAQTRNDARDAWLDCVDAVQRSPFGPLVRIRLTNGSESLSVPDRGSTYRVFAPLGEALHGRQGDVVFLDEGWAHSAERGRELMQAIVPTMATRARPQIWVLSTAGTDLSEFLKELVVAGQAGQNPRMAYFEWSTEEDVSPDDLERVAAAHPAIGHTITIEALKSARAVLKEPAEFLRAYANVWTSALEIVISAAAWTAARDGATIPAGSPVAFGFDVTPDRSHSTIAVAGRNAEGLPVVEIVDHRPGVAWVAPRLRDLVERWKPAAVVGDSMGPATAVIDTLNRGKKIRALTCTSTQQYATACQRMYDLIHEGPAVRIRPSSELDEAALAVGKRKLGEGWAWARRASVPISPLVAATLAVWGLEHPPTHRRPSVVGTSDV